MTYFEYNLERTYPGATKEVEIEVLSFSLDAPGIEVGEIEFDAGSADRETRAA